jgi:hypothetical protein
MFSFCTQHLEASDARAQAIAAIPVHPANLEQGSKAISPKVTGSTLGGALATILWTLLVAYVPGLKDAIGRRGYFCHYRRNRNRFLRLRSDILSWIQLGLAPIHDNDMNTSAA